MPEPVGWLRAVVVDATDLPRLAEFWQAVLGVGGVETAPDWIQLAPDRGGAFMAFEPTPDGQERDRRERDRRERAGFRTRPDIEVDDMDVARTRIEALGGRLVEVIHARPGESHYRMADPEGNEFTVVLPLPPDVARTAYGPKGTPG
jgi:predicted enzyme related to lactoylglutathione lyase